MEIVITENVLDNLYNYYCYLYPDTTFNIRLKI